MKFITNEKGQLIGAEMDMQETTQAMYSAIVKQSKIAGHDLSHLTNNSSVDVKFTNSGALLNFFYIRAPK